LVAMISASLSDIPRGGESMGGDFRKAES